jgi:ergothioneine biosynthesis protein EgtB
MAQRAGQPHSNPQNTRTTPHDLIQRYLDVRRHTVALCAPLAVEDQVIQTMPEVSPSKWHLAHTTWFFETFVLQVFSPGFQPFDAQYACLFNSYYEGAGAMWPRPQRGLLSRPTVEEIHDYRQYVDEALTAFLATAAGQQAAVVERTILGLHHEQQHQELILTDIKHVFAANPLRPVYQPGVAAPAGKPHDISWHARPAGMYHLGHEGVEFAYDNETPRHRTWTDGFALASRLVTNGEFMTFMDDGGYAEPRHWLSDGWAVVKQHDWQAPLYWERRDDAWWHFTLAGMQPVDAAAPVCHVSFYEVDAYARWAGKRLPTELEWEIVAAGEPLTGNFRDSGHLAPVAATSPGLVQLYGDVWEWTASPYTAYPGYQVPEGTVGEYNGKFMCNQWVLRGGSCVTAADHIRASYRNFFYPADRWQFSGIRLAEDR